MIIQLSLYQVACTFKKVLLFTALCGLTVMCKPESNKGTHKTIDVQGHRGCRALMPENTLQGFLYAIDLGVNTLEMDVVVSKDKVVIVSHEPHFSEEITTKPDNTYFTTEEAISSNLYQLNFAEIQLYDVGLKPHPRFPGQKKMAATKPKLEDVVHNCEIKTGGKIHYNIEIKREEKGDGKVQPPLSEFADLVLKVIDSLDIKERTTIQCFDPEVLNYIYTQRKDVKTILLVENLASLTDNLKKLNHKPFAYSPAYKLVNRTMVEELNKNHIRLVPWTVNDSLSISTLIDMGVDGIISDYPDRVIEILKKR